VVHYTMEISPAGQYALIEQSHIANLKGVYKHACLLHTSKWVVFTILHTSQVMVKTIKYMGIAQIKSPCQMTLKFLLVVLPANVE